MSDQPSRLGISVRFPLEDLKDYVKIGEQLHGLTASKVIQAITAEVVAAVDRASHEEIDLTSSWLIRDLCQRDELRAICTRIFLRGERELSNSLTQSIWIGFTQKQGEALSKVAKVLRWPVGKLVQQAVWDALTIVADKSEDNDDRSQDKNAVADIPIIAKFYLGITYAERSIKPGLKKRLDETVKKWKHSKPRPDDSPPDHVGQPIKDDVGIVRDEE